MSPEAILSFCPYLIQATMRHQAQLVYVPSPCGETDAIYSVWNRKERESVSGPDVAWWLSKQDYEGHVEQC